MPPAYAEVLSQEALDFVAALAAAFEPSRRQLMQARVVRQTQLDGGLFPELPSPDAGVRGAAWRVPPAPRDLQDRRVEITGPGSDRKMVLGALNSGACGYMADFEDANSPGWSQCIEGQVNLRDAVRRTLSFRRPDGSEERLKEKTATLHVRPRGLHLLERHLLVDGQPVSASLFDFGLFFFHNVRPLLERGSGPYVYLPKLQSNLEARFWNGVFSHAQNALGIPRGTVRATVLIEHILAAFEMDEILYELRDHVTALNLGRWDYIYSYIKAFRSAEWSLTPDRAQVTMATPFLRSPAEMLVAACHKRGAHALGGMSAFIPRKDDAEVNAKALAQVRTDKEREASQGFDGAWIAHPALVAPVTEVFQKAFTGPNQLGHIPETRVRAADLLAAPAGEITEHGMRGNIGVALQYLEAWVQGRGAVAIANLMEDTATAEIARSQLWHWVKRGAKLADGRPITRDLYYRLRMEEVAKLAAQRNGQGPYALDKAVDLLDELVTSEQFIEFLTIPGYRYLE
jgi:malate synthase